MTPSVKTWCSYRAISWPTTDGVSRLARIEVVGRLPGITLCGTASAGVPAAAISSAVLPNANTWVWAKKLLINKSCMLPVPSAVGRSSVGWLKPRKSAGTIRVPWCSSWEKAFWPLVPGSPQKISPVSVVTGVPSARVDLPLDSMVSCCRYAAKRARSLEYGSTARACASKKFEYHSPIRPSSTGALDSSGAVLKCSSMRWNPDRKSANASRPIAAITESPIAESTEYRPPTQSQKPNMLSVSMPNSSTSFLLVETATKCLATASSPSASVSQRLAAVALVSVSSVVKVLDATMKSVVAGSKSANFAIRSAGSTLDTNRAELPASAQCRNAWSPI